jgi:serine/threonine-protein kinase
VTDQLSHYELLEEVGVGGMGTVWRARDNRDGRTVAVKVLHAHLSRDADYIRRFQREARTAQRIDSPRVVRVMESGSEGDLLPEK